MDLANSTQMTHIRSGACSAAVKDGLPDQLLDHLVGAGEQHRLNFRSVTDAGTQNIDSPVFQFTFDAGKP